MPLNAFEMKLATRTIPFHVDPFLKQFSLSAQRASLRRASPQQLK